MCIHLLVSQKEQSDFKDLKFSWEPLQHMIITLEVSLRDPRVQHDSLD